MIGDGQLRRLANAIPEPNSGCLLWLGSQSKGRANMRSDDGPSTSAARIAYELAYGEFERAKQVLHRCDNPICVEPTHLFLGNPLVNAQDRQRKGRGFKMVGEAHSRSKITGADVLKIGSRYVPRKVTLKTLSREFGVSDVEIGLIVRRKVWKHLP